MFWPTFRQTYAKLYTLDDQARIARVRWLGASKIFGDS